VIQGRLPTCLFPASTTAHVIPDLRRRVIEPRWLLSDQSPISLPEQGCALAHHVDRRGGIRLAGFPLGLADNSLKVSWAVIASPPFALSPSPPSAALRRNARPAKLDESTRVAPSDLTGLDALEFGVGHAVGPTITREPYAVNSNWASLS
jgi:hypothetical protein